MQPSTIEKALHKWPVWGESIISARSKFDFKPMLPGEILRKWKWRNNDAVRAYGMEKLAQLGLPDSTLYYWLACFYSDYIRPDGGIDYEVIRDVEFVEQGKFGKKEYPMIYQSSVIVSAVTERKLLGQKIKINRDAIYPVPQALRIIIKSVRGRPRKQDDLLPEIKRGKLKFEDLLQKISDSGDIQATWQSIYRDKSNLYTAKRKRQTLLNCVYARAKRLWEKAGMKKPILVRGLWSKDLFPIL